MKHTDIHSPCLQANLAATAKQLDRASFELEALRKEKGSIEEHLEAMCQDLKSKQEELNTSAVSICACGTWQHCLYKVNHALYHILLHYRGLRMFCTCDSKK